MTGLEKWVNNAIDIQRRVDRLESTSQLGNSTIAGEVAVAVQAVLEDAAGTNEALPVMQDDIASAGDAASELQDTISAIEDDVEARLEEGRAELEDARAEIADSMQDIEDAFGQTVDGLSEDVETAIVAAGNAKTEAAAASDAARDAAGLAASKGETITQVSAPTGSRANTANLWIDNSLNTAGVPKNQPNRYGPVTVPDPNAVALILQAATANTETEVLRVSVAPGATTPVALTLSVSMALNGLVKSSIGRLRDGVTGAVLASYVFSDKGDSTAGNQETWTLPAGFTATPSASVLVLTIQSNNANSPTVYSLHRTITASNWQAITDQKALDAAAAASTAATAAQAAKTVADQANTAAGVAQQAATDANTAALNAAGIANAKGKVIRQQSKPTGANAAVGNLWIRSSDNTPWAYDATAADWVQVTDKAATDAAAAAVTANQAAVAAGNAAKAAQDTADGKPLILFSSTAGPSGTAPTGTIWFLWDQAKNVAGQWLQSGTLAAPIWTPQQIRSEVIANLDVAKLTAGSAAIATLVAQKIAAATGNFQTANVSNLFVTSGATMSQAVIDYLFANVVQAKKITAGMIDVDSLNGVTLTGLVLKTATSGQRLEIQSTRIDAFSATKSTAAGSFYATDEQGTDYATVMITNSYTSRLGWSSFHVPRNPLAGQYEDARRVNVALSHGLNTPLVQTSQLLMSSRADRAAPVIDGTGSEVIATIDRLRWSPNRQQGGVDIDILSRGGPNKDQAKPRLTTSELYYMSTGAPAVELPVVTEDPSQYGDVIVTARDFRTRAGMSLSTMTTLTVAPTAAVAVNGTTDITSRFTNVSATGALTTAAWSTANGFTVPAGMAGMWTLALSIRSVPGGQAFLQLNGTYVAFQDGTNATLNVPFRLADGDVIKLFAYSTSAGNSAQAATRFTAIRLGS
ncbi:apolipoprotein A1/A4/E family protein [Curtobacterium flaccumfaciens]|uniref:apolipoprotein A1/A4/E family protein n=1 Tax=Curtobacterium flaccumfaciens TaxID=2035 RepID=UPI0021FF9670|nr:apolipoprotein A1/A4/E family protein [Curtobacterium flaccumfaciens]UWD83665.1 apolipoprotein A1/A4/E family protein [Curtobacterium flaccumfaciens]